ncbi:MAG: flagellar motor switch phosphatase FliY [bacterium]
MSGKNVLSQDEINALLDDDENKDIQLSEQEKDIIGEINNIAMGSAASTLHALLNRKVEITAPKVKILTFSQVIENYERPCVIIKIEYIAGLEGKNLLVIKEEDANVIADLMMGGDGTSPLNKLDEVAISAVGEAMNQMMGSASTSLSSILEELINISPPVTEHLTLDDARKEGGFVDLKPSDEIIVTSLRLKVGDLIDSEFQQLSTFDFAKDIVSKLMENEFDGLTSKKENSRQEKISQYTNEATQKLEKTDMQKKQQEHQRKQTPQIMQKNNNENPIKQNREVQNVQFTNFDNEERGASFTNIDLIEDVPVKATVSLGETTMAIREVLDLGKGSVIELNKLAGEPVDLFVNGKLIAKGEVVVIDENFGFRVKQIISPIQRK